MCVQKREISPTINDKFRARLLYIAREYRSLALTSSHSRTAATPRTLYHSFQIIRISQRPSSFLRKTTAVAAGTWFRCSKPTNNIVNGLFPSTTNSPSPSLSLSLSLTLVLRTVLALPLSRFSLPRGHAVFFTARAHEKCPITSERFLY